MSTNEFVGSPFIECNLYASSFNETLSRAVDALKSGISPELLDELFNKRAASLPLTQTCFHYFLIFWSINFCLTLYIC
jgi:hypothetical protein